MDTAKELDPAKDDDAATAGTEIEDHVEIEVSEKSESASFFDMSSLCCSFGSKGPCAHCGVTIMNSDQFVAVEGESSKVAHAACVAQKEAEKQEELEGEMAVQIQSAARGKIARDNLASMKAQKEMEAAAAAAAAKEAAALEEAKRQQQIDETASVSKKPKKSGFLAKIGALFQGCKKADSQVVEAHSAPPKAETPVEEVDEKVDAPQENEVEPEQTSEEEPATESEQEEGNDMKESEEPEQIMI